MHRDPVFLAGGWLACALSLMLVACSDDDAGPDPGCPGTGCEDGGAPNGGADAGDAIDAGDPGVWETGRLEGMTAAHNQARAAVEPPADPPIPPLTWDPAAAAVAQDWAEDLAARGCPLEHASTSYGENIFMTSGSATPGDVVGLWMLEADCYDYEAIECNLDECHCGFGPCPSCLHYTQVVWRNSERLGCGVADCPGGGEIWVCNYDPAGNVNVGSTRPY